ncbi:MAG TPA: hypothetical protein VJR05_15875 [Acidimicrobiia bacterium]|nr:hypothetical protein [Acidimicrobiia bacterium]
MRDRMRHRLVDLVVGVFAGALIAAVLAVNMVIYSGIPQGYEAGLVEVFNYNSLLGIAVVIVLLAGPLLGVLTMVRLRRRKSGVTRTN